MAITVIQVCSTTVAGASAASWGGAPFLSNVTPGSCIAVCVSWNTAAGSVTSVTDNLNTGNYIAFPSSFIQGNVRSMGWFYKAGSKPGAMTITVTLSAGQTGNIFEAIEIGGVGLPATTDGAVAIAGATTVTPTVGPLTPTAVDIFLAAFRAGTFTSGQSDWVSPTITGIGPGALQYLIETDIIAHTDSCTITATATYVASEIAFQSQSSFNLTADSPTLVQATSATLNGTIVSAGGGGASTSFGFNYGLTPNFGTTVTSVGSITTGSFSIPVTGLIQGNLYYFQSWALNSNGVSTSDIRSFSTLKLQYVVQVSNAVALGNGAASWSVSPFTNPVNPGSCIAVAVSWNTAVGSVVSIQDNLNSGNYTAFPASIVQAQSKTIQWFYKGGSSPGNLKITVTLSAGQASDLFWAFEIGSIGLPVGLDGAVTSSGAITSSLLCGPLTPTVPADLMLVAFRGGTFITGASGWISPVIAGSGQGQVQYIVDAATVTHTASATTDGSGAYAGSLVAFKAATSFPNLTADGATGIGGTSATLNGTIVSEGGFGNAVTWGFAYGLSTTYGNIVATGGSINTGSFALPVTGLAPGVIYHYISWATNSGGTFVSTDLTFTTASGTHPGAGEILLTGTGTPLFKGSTDQGDPSLLFDADNTTVWTTLDVSTWCGIDCGVATTLTRLRFSPRSASEDTVIGGTLNANLSDPTFVSGTVVLYTFPNARPLTGSLLNEVLVSPGATYRYYNAQAPSTHTNCFYDLDFIGTWASGVYSRPVTPVVSPPYANVDEPVVVTISTITTSASIYYTLDGTTPTPASTLYTGPFVVASDSMLLAIAYDQMLSTPASRVAKAYFVIPSKLYSKHFFADVNRGYKLCSFEGCVIQDPVSKWWYQYGACSDLVTNPSNLFATLGTNVYRSADLLNWTYMGNICGPSPGGQVAWRHKYAIRPCVFYNVPTQLYVTWFATDNTLSKGLEVWTSPYPDARQPWTHAATYNAASPPNDGSVVGAGSFYGDCGFLNDPVSGNAYLIYNYNSNGNTSISKLDPANYTNFVPSGSAQFGPPVVGEAHSIIYNNGTYFWIFSQLTGQSYNLNQYMTSSTPIGPWTGPFNPFQTVSGDYPPHLLAYNSQVQQLVRIPGRGQNAIYLICQDADSEINSQVFYGAKETKLNLPVTFPTPTTMSVTWDLTTNWFEAYPNATILDSSWRLDAVFPTVSGAPAPASNLIVSLNSATWQNNEPFPAHIYLDGAPDTRFSVGVISEILPSGATSFSIRLPTVQRVYRIRTVNASGTSVSGFIQPVTPVTVSVTGIYVIETIYASYQAMFMLAAVDYSTWVAVVKSGPYDSDISAYAAIQAII